MQVDKNKQYTLEWDLKVKPAARNVIKFATVDKECITEYVGKMIRAVEHDIIDGRYPGLNSLNCLMQVKGVFSRDNPTYFKNIHSDTPEIEIKQMRELSDLIDGMLKMA